MNSKKNKQDNVNDTLNQKENNADSSEFLKENKLRNLDFIAKKFKIRNNEQLFKNYFPTGFPALDKTLGGGFTPGVHYIGAISSLGKSTFVLQMLNNMANNGLACIFVSLEMSAIDLTAKLVSMYSFLVNKEHAKAMNELLSREACQNFTEEDWQIIFGAAEKIETFGEKISIYESQNKPININDISNYIQNYILAYQQKPIVVIDYLQILSLPKELRVMNDKQAVDYNVAKFRMIAATYQIPIIVISSFNRNNYSSQVSFQAFKDSGNIEYSADTLIGLQFQKVGPNFDFAAAKKQTPRKIELSILKNRNGAIDTDLAYDFYPKYNYFVEKGTVEEVQKKEKIKNTTNKENSMKKNPTTTSKRKNN